MKQWIAGGLLLGSLCLGSAFAQDTSGRAPGNSQQERMKFCNVEAKLKTGEERKEFMRQCLAAKTPAAENRQQQKMKECNRRAEGRKGDERKSFMKECLSS